MDFLIGLKHEESGITFTNLKKMLIFFCYFGNGEYVEMICLHIMLFEYHRIIEHPHVDLFLNNLINLVGEDIELGKRALSPASTRNARRSNLEILDRAYRLLRSLRVAGVQFG